MRVNGTEMLTFVLAQPDFPGGEPPGSGQGEGFGKSTPVGLFLLIVLLIGVAFLVRSMSKHVRGLPTKFDQSRATAAAPKRVQRAEAAAAAKADEDEASTGEGSGEARDGPDDVVKPENAVSEDGTEEESAGESADSGSTKKA